MGGGAGSEGGSRERDALPAGRVVPARALLLSAGALGVPLAASGLLSGELADQLGLLLWLTALIPGFLLSYYKGWSGSALALAAGMVVLALSNLTLSVRGIEPPSLSATFLFVAAFLGVSIGLGWVTELLHRERRTAQEQALTDALTRLPNRRHAEIFLEAAFGAARQSGMPMSVVVFDLDHFKRLNDTQGHAAGDEVLRSFADLLRVHAAAEQLVARVGGEELLAVLPGKDLAGGRSFAEAVRSDLSRLDLRWQPLTVSAGVATLVPDMRRPEALQEAADAALYMAKELGRDRVEVAAGVVAAPEEGVAATQTEPGEPAPTSPRGLIVLADPAARKSVRRALELNGLRVEEFGQVEAVPIQVGGTAGPLALVVGAAEGNMPLDQRARALAAVVGEEVPLVLFAPGSSAGDPSSPLPAGVTVLEGSPSGERLLPLLSRLLLHPVVRGAGSVKGLPQGLASRLGGGDVPLTEGRVMVVDDERSNRVALRRTLEELGFRDLVVLATGEDAVRSVPEELPDLIILDLHMPGMDGFHVLEALQPHIEADGFLPILVVTGDKQWELRQRALRMGAKDFLNKPFDVSELGARVLNLLETRQLHLGMRDVNRLLESRVRERTRELARAKDEILYRLALAAEYRDDVTGRHAERVGLCSQILSRTLGLGDDRSEIIRRAAPLHDIGKIAIPDAILLKPGPLSDAEMDVMRSHTTIGADLLAESSSDVIQEACGIALTHHERWDGGGYPQGLGGEHIPVEGRVVAVADAMDALTHTRPYKRPIPFEEACRRVRADSGTAFDPLIVDALETATAEVAAVLAGGE